MAITSLEPQCEGPFDRDPLLMEHSESQNGYSDNHDIHEHVIDMSRGGVASSSVSHDAGHDSLEESHSENLPSTSTQAPVSQPLSSASRNVVHVRRGGNYIRRHRSPLNSGLWISFETIVVISQIVAAVVVLLLSRHEKPKTPLFEWVVCYTVGCVATLPHLYWRYVHRNDQSIEQESTHAQQDSSDTLEASYSAISLPQAPNRENQHSTESTSENRQNLRTTNPRLIALVDHFKMALDFFFAVWFVVGNIWVFGRHSSLSDAPNLYRLCIVFLTFSCIGYAMPFILCATICCCLPCIISLLGFREDMTQNRGATSELINALPTYKFTSKSKQNQEESEINSNGSDEGGILAAGSDKERTVSAEDAVCCICLARYMDNDVLRELPCTHFFHMECVDKWLKINALCPLCKADVGEAAASASHASPFRRHG